MATPRLLQRALFHVLYFGPGLGPEWLFTAARGYVIAFRPIVTETLQTVALVPLRRSLAVTSVMRRDSAKRAKDEIARLFPRAYHDALVYDFPEEVQITLDGRTTSGQRLGLPEA